MISKIIIEGLIYMVLFSLYMIFSDKPFLFTNFWRTYFWVLMYAFPLTIFITLLPISESAFQKLLILSIIIFLFELLLFNVINSNKDIAEWGKYCTSTLFGYIFSISIATLLIVSLVINKFF